MKRQLMTAAAACTLAIAAVGCAGMTRATVPATGAQGSAPAAAEAFPVTAAGALAFVADAEARLADLLEYAARVQWVRATNITFDTMWLESRANAQVTELQAQLATEAARFNDVQVPEDVRRKLNLLRLGIVLPAPNRPGAAAELAEITTRLDSTYATGKFEYQGRGITLDDKNFRLCRIAFLTIRQLARQTGNIECAFASRQFAGLSRGFAGCSGFDDFLNNAFGVGGVLLEPLTKLFIHRGFDHVADF